MKRFIMVDWEMLKYGLSPLELLLYAFIKPYTDKGIGYETKYADLAEIFSVTEGQLKYAVKHLKEDGFLVVKRRQYDVVLTTVQKSKNEQSEKSKNKQSETPQKSKLTLSEIKNRQVSHITSNNKNNRENIDIIPPVQKGNIGISESDGTPPQPEETQEPETVTAETEPASSIEQRRYEIILRLIAEQYTERGDIYIPNYATQTTVALSLVRKVEALMQHYKVADTDDQFADVWRRFLTAGYESGDQFQREHWTLDYIDKQFMAIFNKLNSENNGKQGTNRSGKGNARISADYVQKTMREAGITF